jgi:hypothetical protein
LERVTATEDDDEDDDEEDQKDAVEKIARDDKTTGGSLFLCSRARIEPL